MRWLDVVSMVVVAFSLKFTHVYSQPGSKVLHCGTTNEDPFSNRIVGGIEAVPHEFPWMVKLFYQRSFHCGSALIADKYVLTAGHCVTAHLDGTSTEPRLIRGNVRNYEILSPADFFVELGSHYIKERGPGVIRRKVESIILHPAYDVFSSNDIMLQTNDIALLRIPAVTFSSSILPVCLPAPGARIRDNASLLVAGWGSTLTETLENPITKLPDALQKATLTKISFKSCQSNRFVGMHLTPLNQMTDHQIFCMVGKNQDSCRGDSGGPAVMRTAQGFVMAGLVSWGIGCNQVNYPAAYTQVSSYMDFVLSNTQDGRFLPHVP